MEWLHKLRLQFRSLARRRQLDRDLEDELRFHFGMKSLRGIETGLTPEQAARVARQQYGNPLLWKEEIRNMWTLGWFEGVMQDVRYATRSLWKAPAFTLAAVMVLGLGIGSNTAIFSMVNSVLLRSLPFEDPDRLVLLWGNVQRQRMERRGASYPDYADWKAQSKSFDGMAAFNDAPFIVSGNAEPERIGGEWVSAGYFELLGVKPSRGRTIRADEDQPGKAADVVVISEGLWARRFGSDPRTIGSTIQLNNRAFTVIGIMPAWFRGLTSSAELWAPFTASSSAAGLSERGSRSFPALARLRPGIAMTQAQSEMDGISASLERAYPRTNEKRSVEVAGLSNEVVGQLRTPLLVLLGAVTLVLLIACANVANLLLARSESRRQEMAIRAALGAGRWRVFRQLIVESLLLSLMGTVLGVLLSVWVVDLLAKASPVSLPSFLTPAPDWMVAMFAAGVSIVVGLLVGMMPAFHAGSRDVHDTLKDSSARTGGQVTQRRFRSALVISEVAIAMTLLVGAGLLMRSFHNLMALRPGFDPKGMLTMAVSLPRAQSGSPAVTGRLLLERIRSLPSVTSASVASDIPLGPGSSAIFYRAEGQPELDAQARPRAYIHRVSPDFFTTIGARLIAGRTFTDAEIESRAPVVVVTENLAKRFWPGQDPIGKRIGASNEAWWTIAGVVGDMKYRGLPDNPTADPDIFLPFSDRQSNIAILIRTSLDPAKLTAAVRAAVREVDSTIPVYAIATMTERVDRAIERSRFAGWMMAVFAALALTLSAVGLYGVMGYTVRQRTRELGVRIAIGASPHEVSRLVVRNGMMLVAAGIAIGTTCALALGRLLDTLLFGISAIDPLVFAGVAATLFLVAFIACYLPARRASRIDPVTALRAS